MAENKKESKNRARRRRRRARNRALSFLFILILLAGVCFGGYIGVKYLMKLDREKHARDEQELAEVLSENAIVSENIIHESVLPEVQEPEEVAEEEAPFSEADMTPEERAAWEAICTMPLEQKIAGLFVVHPEAITGVDTVVLAGEGTKNALSLNHIGGFWYRKENVTGADAFKEMLEKTQIMHRELYGTDLLLFVQEEGAISTVAGEHTGEAVIDTAQVIGNSGDQANAYNGYLFLATMLKNYGINANFGVCASVKQNENCFLGDRCFSGDAEVVSQMVNSAVRGLTDQKVLACLEAFPGEGELEEDPGEKELYVEASLEELNGIYFAPFRSGVEAGAQMVQMSAAYYTNAFVEDVPATLSAKAIEALRENIGFDGVVVSADLSCSSIATKYSAAEASVQALQAGCDLILCPSDYALAYAAVAAVVADGTISEDRINESLMRVYMMRQANGL